MSRGALRSSSVWLLGCDSIDIEPMSDLWHKLNLGDRTAIAVLNAPDSFAPRLRELPATVAAASVLDTGSRVELVLAFVTRRAEIEALAARLGERAPGDPVVWLAYPKKSSKRYSCDFSRDDGWQPLGEAGFEAVRQVAVDEDWSALRFRRVEHIRSMRRQRGRAMTAAGKAKSSGG